MFLPFSYKFLFLIMLINYGGWLVTLQSKGEIFFICLGEYFEGIRFALMCYLLVS
ncbi:hypothetical protein F5Y09DRAFT_318276 [Xylaria sp. FL1042]|nr:hypothetical protein F5Y09DRAFT_318276 [Xylaria sp. FL1042]